MRARILLLIVLSGLTFFAGLGRPAISDSDEAYYAEAGREMVESGDYLTPHYNYEFRFQKPALFYWLVAGTYRVAGASEVAARLWAAMAGLGLVLVTFAAARRAADDDTALLAGAIAATSLGYFATARMSLPDLPLAFFVTFSTWAGLEALLRSGNRESEFVTSGGAGLAAEGEDSPRAAGRSDAPRGDSRRRSTSPPPRPLHTRPARDRSRVLWSLSAAAAGLAFLTKGPVGVVLPAIVVVAVAGVEWRRVRLGTADLLAAVAVFLVIGVPWYAEMWRVHGNTYLHSFFVGDNLERFATTRFNGPRSLFFYVPMVLAGLLPWSPFLFLLVAPAFSVVRRRRSLTPVEVRLIAWAGLPLLFFSISIGKQPRYILPVLPPLAILVARAVQHRLHRPDGRGRDWEFVLWGTAAGGVVIALGAAIYLLRPLLLSVRPGVVVNAARLVWVAGAAVIAVAWSGAWRRVPAVLAVAGVVVLLAAQYTILSSAGPEPVQQAASIIRATLQPGDAWTTYDHPPDGGAFVRNLVFYVGRKEAGPYGERELVQVVKSPQRLVFAVVREDLPPIEEQAGFAMRRHGEVLYFNTATLTAGKLFRPDPVRDIRTVLVVSNY